MPFAQVGIRTNPDACFHSVWQGAEIDTERPLDLVTWISIVEHLYDLTFVLDPGQSDA